MANEWSWNLMTTKVGVFWRSFLAREHEFQEIQDADTLVAAIQAILNKVSPKLGVEVSTRDDFGRRRVIFVANGHQKLVPLVKSLVDVAPKLVSWEFIALKPRAGFAFTFNQNGKRLFPSQWKFKLLRSEEMDIGLSIYIPGQPVRMDAEILALIIETGLGGNTFHHIKHIDYVQDLAVSDESSWISLAQLPEFMDWLLAKQL